MVSWAIRGFECSLVTWVWKPKSQTWKYVMRCCVWEWGFVLVFIWATFEDFGVLFKITILGFGPLLSRLLILFLVDFLTFCLGTFNQHSHFQKLKIKINIFYLSFLLFLPTPTHSFKINPNLPLLQKIKKKHSPLIHPLLLKILYNPPV